jgi:hypothetical protein
VNDTKEWKKENLVNSKVLFPKAYKKPNKLTPDCQCDSPKWKHGIPNLIMKHSNIFVYSTLTIAK